MQRIKKIGTTHNGENFEYWDYKNNTLNYHEKLGKGYPSQVNHEIITYSQLDQDVFVQRSTNFLENKTFVDIGAAHPIAINNTYLLESKYNWSGVSFELGINAYLRKPFNIYALKGIVRQNLLLKKIQNDLKMQIELKDELASKLKEDKLHFMGLVQEKLTDEEKDTFMKELFNFFENE